jgi:integrase
LGATFRAENQNISTRQVYWVYDEAQNVIADAGKKGFLGLQAALAVAWDTMMSPVDVRSLTLSQMTRHALGEIFQVDRAKTGKAAIGTLTPETLALLKAYIAGLPFTLHPDTPIFHTRGALPGPKGGRPRPPAPYTKDTLSKDFREVRKEGDKRTVGDFRRSGAIEVIAGQGDAATLAGKMANTIDSNRDLQATYLPNVAQVVRMADQARDRGRVVLRANKGGGDDR